MTDEPEPITKAPPAASTPTIIYLPSPPNLAPSTRHKRRSGSEKRQRANKPIFVRLLPEERALVEEKAATAGLSMAAYARACMLGDGGPRARKRPPVNRALLAVANADLNRVGNNLNQALRAFHARGEMPLCAEIEEMRRELLATLSDIRRALGYGRKG
jgi:hypothetical protein